MSLRQTLLSNVSWLLISVVLAVSVWYLARVQADPIQQQQYRNISLQITPDEGFILNNQPTSSVTVTLRAPRSVFATLTRDDITISAPLNGLPAGVHTVPLAVRIGRAGIISVDSQPTQITVSLEPIEVAQKPVSLVVDTPPPTDFSYEALTADILQAQVRGAASKVTAVVSVRGELDLGNARNPLAVDVPLFAYDANDQRVSDVTLIPASARATVNIFARPDVKQLTVRPNLLFETLPEGYVFQSVRIEPQVVYISGAPSVLAQLNDTINTQPIDLTNRTALFEVRVPLDLPSDNLLILNNENTIFVQVGVTALITARQFDNIPVEVIGIPPNHRATLSPPTISVVLNGPLDVLQDIEATELQAIIDANSLAAGTYERIPTLLIQGGQQVVDSYQLLPSSIALTLQTGTPPGETTPEATAPPN